jgi:hypothetical protein
MFDQRQKRLAAIAALAVFIVALGAGQENLARAENQPRMERAIDLLIEARAHLQNATPDKGGHRVKAIGQINRAIT